MIHGGPLNVKRNTQADDGWAVLRQFPCHYIIAIEMHILVTYPPTIRTVRESRSNGKEKLVGVGE